MHLSMAGAACLEYFILTIPGQLFRVIIASYEQFINLIYTDLASLLQAHKYLPEF